MRSCSFYSVLNRCATLAGFPVAQLPAVNRAQMQLWIADDVKIKWEHWWWPEIMASEQRYYRDAFDADTSYAIGDQVVYSGSYYQASAATTGNLPTDTDYWAVLTDLDPYISLTQLGQSVIGTVRLLSQDNPLQKRSPRRVPFVLGANGIQVIGQAISPLYVWFREPVPDFSGADWSAETAYASGTSIYYASSTSGYEGDYWVAQSATLAAQSPETDADLWTKTEFPLWLRETVAHGAYANWLRQDGAPDLATLAEQQAQLLLYHEQDLLAGQQGQIIYSRTT